MPVYVSFSARGKLRETKKYKTQKKKTLAVDSRG
jgi:hypothetical protein